MKKINFNKAWTFCLNDGKEIGTHEIVSEGKAEKISLVKEESYIPKHAPKPSCEIIYVDARITDKDGKICNASSKHQWTYKCRNNNLRND